MPSRSSSASPAVPSVHEDLYEQPGHLIRRAHQICCGLFAELVDPEVTPVQYAILRALHETPGVDQVSLARFCGLDTSTTAQTAARLQNKGLLNREPSQTDRRQWVLTLSPQGERLITDLIAGVHVMRERLLAPFNAQEREQFMALLGKFVHLNNDSSRAPLQARQPSARPVGPRRRTPPQET